MGVKEALHKLGPEYAAMEAEKKSKRKNKKLRQ